MKYVYVLTAALLLSAAFTSRQASAQCTHDPTVTPSAPILCPNETDTLWTQVYDSYQWYKDGNPVPGATQQFLVVDAANDVGSNFAVEATVSGCAEMSPPVLVDGWAFLLPTVMSAGDFQTGGNGEALLCEGDTLWLILQLPYTANIQWTDNGIDIAGATDDTLIVTQSGDFSVSGAPGVCPNYILNLGVTIPVIFSAPPAPVISLDNGQLVVNPAGYTYQWYLDGDTLNGITGDTIAPQGEGDYTVEIFDSIGCSKISAPFPFMFTGTDDPAGITLTVFPNPTAGVVNISGLGHAEWMATVTDLAGRNVWEGPGKGDTQLNLQGLETGNYLLHISVPATGQVVSRMIRKQ